MGGKFLVFVMLYLMVDISLVLCYEGTFRVMKSVDGRRRFVICTWTTPADGQFKVACDDEKNCLYYGDATGCPWYTTHKEEYFKRLATEAYKTRFNGDAHYCNADKNLAVYECGGVSWSITHPTLAARISKGLLWEDE